MAQALGALFNERAQQPPKFDLMSMLAHGEATREHADPRVHGHAWRC